MANPRTIARLEARIRERVAYCLEFELNDPRVTFATVTRVELTSDLSSAKVYYSVMGTPADQRTCQRALESATGFVRRQLGRVLKTRTIPKLSWFYDDSIRHAAEMDQKIREALERDRAINPEAHENVQQVDAIVSASMAGEVERLDPTIPKPAPKPAPGEPALEGFDGVSKGGDSEGGDSEGGDSGEGSVEDGAPRNGGTEAAPETGAGEPGDA